jgi:hypothetical protein
MIDCFVYKFFKSDIRCVSSDRYIKSFKLNWISIVIHKLNGYIGLFNLVWVFVVICILMDSWNYLIE